IEEDVSVSRQLRYDTAPSTRGRKRLATIAFISLALIVFAAGAIGFTRFSPSAAPSVKPTSGSSASASPTASVEQPACSIPQPSNRVNRHSVGQRTNSKCAHYFPHTDSDTNSHTTLPTSSFPAKGIDWAGSGRLNDSAELRN
ncbi:MAG: hypothetical protein ACXV5P_09820, partial [Halobacteriota archaeon]